MIVLKDWDLAAVASRAFVILFLKEGAVVDRVIGAAPKAVLQNIVNARAS